ncbi:hypothetical protein CDAR_271901 [Caerostris darwini]|uniref:Uncharacterized protein n=1 Tax=Caerostris darwini TaxID=1538125 RepID=A0AAV4WAV0_9ARAC|nr:hypothetical protein CDAR_271901 [Caerostris darwini]
MSICQDRKFNPLSPPCEPERGARLKSRVTDIFTPENVAPPSNFDAVGDSHAIACPQWGRVQNPVVVGNTPVD